LITQWVIDLSKEYGPTKARSIKGVKESHHFNLKNDPLKNEKMGYKCKIKFHLFLEEFVLLLLDGARISEN